MIPYRKGDKWGFCTPSKDIVITPVYDNVSLFGERCLAPIQLDGKYGVIDHRGNVIIPFRYDQISSFSQQFSV